MNSHGLNCNLEDTVMLREAKSIVQIATPLSKLIDVDYFGMVRIYKDNTHYTLVTLPTWIKQFYQNYFHHGICHKSFNAYETGFYFQEQSIDQTTIKIMKQDFNVSPAFTIVDKKKHYCDLYSFASSKHSMEMTAYIKHLTVFHNFIRYFHEKAEKILFEAEKDRKLLPKLLKESTKSAPLRGDKLQKKLMQISGYFEKEKRCLIKKIIQLTNRELECVYHIAQGETQEEVACKLHVSKRTIETHLSHAKEKLNAKNMTHLVAKILQFLPC